MDVEAANIPPWKPNFIIIIFVDILNIQSLIHSNSHPPIYLSRHLLRPNLNTHTHENTLAN